MKGKIVTVMTTAGEFVGRLTEQDNGVVTLSDPRYVVQSHEGMGFANGVALTGVKDPKEITIYNTIFIAETSEEVQDSWRQSTSGVVAPSSKIIT